MPANKKTTRKSPDKNYPDEKKPGGNAQANDQNLHRPYQGYDDEDKTTNYPAYESDYDVDENDSNQRLGEYSDWVKTGNRNKK